MERHFSLGAVAVVSGTYKRLLPLGGDRLAGLSVWIDIPAPSVQTDSMASTDIAAAVGSDDPALGLRAVGALHRLAEQVEARHVELARAQGWSWEQIGDALGVSRQSVHTKHAKKRK